jgi:hypothetical protein
MKFEEMYPSWPEQGKNLAKFAFEIVKSAMKSDALFVSNEIKEHRLSICRQCDYYDESQVRCRHCGCMLEHKAKFALDSCPIDKWKESDIDWVTTNYDKVIDSLQNTTEKPIDRPMFPSIREVGDQYTWNDLTWTWNGEMWELPE